MIQSLKARNPSLSWHTVDSPAFLTYGRVLTGVETQALCRAAKQLAPPETGSRYVAAEDAFAGETARFASFFGGLSTQVGYCWGHNRQLNAVEWHASSEINVAVTPLVLLLGHIWDICGDTYDSKNIEAFFVPAGTALEIYATTLHYCPCEVQEDGFGCVVALPKGSNTPLPDGAPKEPTLFAVNKRLLAHRENAPLLARGAAAGVFGENYTIAY